MVLASESRARWSGVSMRGADGGALAVEGDEEPPPPPPPLARAGLGLGLEYGAGAAPTDAVVPRTMVTLPPSTSLQPERPLIWLVYSLPQR